MFWVICQWTRSVISPLTFVGFLINYLLFLPLPQNQAIRIWWIKRIWEKVNQFKGKPKSEKVHKKIKKFQQFIPRFYFLECNSDWTQWKAINKSILFLCFYSKQRIFYFICCGWVKLNVTLFIERVWWCCWWWFCFWTRRIVWNWLRSFSFSRDQCVRIT